MGTPKYNPPTKNSWVFGLVLVIVSLILVFADIVYGFVENPSQGIPWAWVIGWMSSTIAAGWLLAATRFKDM